MSQRLYSAVVDPRGIFPDQAQRLVWSLTELAGVHRSDVILHQVGSADADVAGDLKRLGVEIVEVEAFPGHVYCNKLQQLESLSSRAWDDVVLLDCDVIVLEEPPDAGGFVWAKPVDSENPKLEVLQAIYSAARLPLSAASTDIDSAPTAVGYANGGVYVIDRTLFGPLSDSWRKWALWGIKNIGLFQRWPQHVDQVAFALAVAELSIPFRELPRRFNVPTHRTQPAELDVEPAILHYHSALDSQQFLRQVPGLPKINAAIQRVNHSLQAARASGFDEALTRATS